MSVLFVAFLGALTDWSPGGLVSRGLVSGGTGLPRTGLRGTGLRSGLPPAAVLVFPRGHGRIEWEPNHHLMRRSGVLPAAYHRWSSEYLNVSRGFPRADTLGGAKGVPRKGI